MPKNEFKSIKFKHVRSCRRGLKKTLSGDQGGISMEPLDVREFKLRKYALRNQKEKCSIFSLLMEEQSKLLCKIAKLINCKE